MRKRILATAIALCVAIPGSRAAVAETDVTESPQVHEFLKCKLHEGKTREDLVAVLNAWRAAVNQAGYVDYKIKILIPVHASDTRLGVFYWMGIWKNYARMGLGWNWWLGAKETPEVASKLNEVFGCESDEVTIVALER